MGRWAFPATRWGAVFGQTMGEWVSRALCAQTDPELFFPERGESGNLARRICADCEVREECLEFALKDPTTVGVWGGTTTHQRRQINQQRRGRNK